jgi:hypothetical protein
VVVALSSWPGWLSPWEWSPSDWAGLTFLVLVSAAVVALGQVREAQRLREDQARPFVVIDFEPWNVFIDLKIRNIGKTLAHDVRFQFEPTLKTVKDEKPGLVPVMETYLFTTLADLSAQSPTRPNPRVRPLTLPVDARPDR